MRSLAIAVVAAIVVALGAACSHEAWDGRVFHAGRESFRTGDVPATWRRVQLEGVQLAFHDDASNGSITVHAQCGRDADDVPLSALTKHLLIGFTEREFTREDTIPFDGREALHTEVFAKLDGVRLGLSIYVLKKDGCVYDLVYVAAPDRYPTGLPAFDSFVRGFSTTAQ
jgi:hypothetical protein